MRKLQKDSRFLLELYSVNFEKKKTSQNKLAGFRKIERLYHIAFISYAMHTFYVVKGACLFFYFMPQTAHMVVNKLIAGNAIYLSPYQLHKHLKGKDASWMGSQQIQDIKFTGRQADFTAANFNRPVFLI